MKKLLIILFIAISFTSTAQTKLICDETFMSSVNKKGEITIITSNEDICSLLRRNFKYKKYSSYFSRNYKDTLWYKEYVFVFNSKDFNIDRFNQLLNNSKNEY